MFESKNDKGNSSHKANNSIANLSSDNSGSWYLEILPIKVNIPKSFFRKKKNQKGDVGIYVRAYIDDSSYIKKKQYSKSIIYHGKRCEINWKDLENNKSLNIALPPRIHFNTIIRLQLIKRPKGKFVRDQKLCQYDINVYNLYRKNDFSSNLYQDMSVQMKRYKKKRGFNPFKKKKKKSFNKEVNKEERLTLTKAKPSPLNDDFTITSIASFSDSIADDDDDSDDIIDAKFDFKMKFKKISYNNNKKTKISKKKEEELKKFNQNYDLEWEGIIHEGHINIDSDHNLSSWGVLCVKHIPEHNCNDITLFTYHDTNRNYLNKRFNFIYGNNNKWATVNSLGDLTFSIQHGFKDEKKKHLIKTNNFTCMTSASKRLWLSKMANAFSADFGTLISPDDIPYEKPCYLQIRVLSASDIYENREHKEQCPIAMLTLLGGLNHQKVYGRTSTFPHENSGSFPRWTDELYCKSEIYASSLYDLKKLHLEITLFDEVRRSENWEHIPLGGCNLDLNQLEFGQMEFDYQQGKQEIQLYDVLKNHKNHKINKIDSVPLGHHKSGTLIIEYRFSFVHSTVIESKKSKGTEAILCQPNDYKIVINRDIGQKKELTNEIKKIKRQRKGALKKIFLEELKKKLETNNNKNNLFQDQNEKKKKMQNATIFESDTNDESTNNSIKNNSNDDNNNLLIHKKDYVEKFLDNSGYLSFLICYTIGYMHLHFIYIIFIVYSWRFIDGYSKKPVLHLFRNNGMSSTLVLIGSQCITYYVSYHRLSLIYLPIIYAMLLYTIDALSLAKIEKQVEEDAKKNSSFSFRNIRSHHVEQIINFMPDSVLSGPADRVAWINDLINSMWPYLQTHVENTVIKKKMHENYLFMNSIMPMGVPKPLHLRVGKAPVFQGILVVDDVRDSLRIEMEMWIVGDSEVAIEYGGMQFILSNFKMKTKLRIDLGPLLYTAPLFEKVRFTCLEIKDVDYDVNCVLGNFTEFPFFLNTFLKGMKFGLNKEGLLFPKVKTKVLGVNKNKHEGIFCEGILEIDVQYASNLINKDGTTGISDPFVVIDFGGEKKKTRVIKNSLNPNWNERIIFLCSLEVPEKCIFSVYDFDGKKDALNNDSLGQCSMTTSRMMSHKWHEHNDMLLQNVPSGNLTVKTRYQRLQQKKQEYNPNKDCAFEIDFRRIHQCKYEHNPWPFKMVLKVVGTNCVDQETKHFRLSCGETHLYLNEKLSMVLANRDNDKDEIYLEIEGICSGTVDQLPKDFTFGRIKIPIEDINDNTDFDKQFQPDSTDTEMRLFLPRLELGIRYFAIEKDPK